MINTDLNALDFVKFMRGTHEALERLGVPPARAAQTLGAIPIYWWFEAAEGRSPISAAIRWIDKYDQEVARG